MSVEFPRPEGLAELDPPGRFAWLREKHHRRSALIEVQATLSRGSLDAEGRAALIAELEALRDSGELSGREAARVDRIFRAIAAQEARGWAVPGQGTT
jgi:hypothetical protein